MKKPMKVADTYAADEEDEITNKNKITNADDIDTRFSKLISIQYFWYLRHLW